MTVAATAGADSTYDDGDEMSDAGSENSEPLQIGAPPPPANAGSNPWAPLDQAPPSKIEPVSSVRRQGGAPATHQLLERTLAAVTSLQQCVATLSAAVNSMNSGPPQATATNPPPQPRRSGGQPTSTLADLIMDPTSSRKRYVTIVTALLLIFFVFLRTYSQANPASTGAALPTPPSYPHPTPIHSQWTADIRRAASITYTGGTGVGRLEPSFAQLRATYAQDLYVNNLGKFNTEDPKRQSRLAYANLRENRAARRDLSALNAARSHLYGERVFGYKNWYTDKANLARRLKSQTHRRQFRMGLKAGMEFWNQLRIGDLRAAVTEGDPAILRNLPSNTKASVTQFREFFSLAPAVDVLKLFVPHKADAIIKIMNGIESLADFNQRLNRHLASHPALEPIHAVICDMLRSGEDFSLTSQQTPLGIATQALQHICTTPDEDANFGEKKRYNKTAAASNRNGYSGGRTDEARSGRSGGARGRARLRRCCFMFQFGTCTRTSCVYRHICDNCASTEHGRSMCQEPTINQ